MKKSMLVWFALIAAPGCAGVLFEKKVGDGDTGFSYYPAKPYLLVERGKDGDKVSVVSLPDLSDERYVRYKRGWGTAEFGFEVQNGMIVKFNSKTDSKGPETLGAIASLGTAAAGIMSAQAALITAEAALGTAAQAAEGMTAAPVVQVQQAWKTIQESVLDKITAASGKEIVKIKLELEPLHTALGVFTSVEYKTGDAEARKKAVDAARAGVRELLPAMKRVRERLATISKDPKAFPEEWHFADQLLAALDDAIEKLSAFAIPLAGPELYEIRVESGVLSLRRVAIVIS